MSAPSSSGPGPQSPEDAETKRLAQEKAGHEARDAKWKSIATIAGAVVAVLTVATTLISIFAVGKNTEANDQAQLANAASVSVQTLTSVVDANASELQAAQGTIASQSAALSAASAEGTVLAQSNAALSSALASATIQVDESSAPEAGNTPAPGSSAGTIRHQSQVTLAPNGDWIDMNAPATDPSWGQGQNAAGQTARVPADLALWDARQVRVGADYLVLIGSETPSYEVCKRQTGYFKDGADLTTADISSIPRVCLKLSSGRYATMKVIETGDVSSRLTLEITTWEL